MVCRPPLKDIDFQKPNSVIECLYYKYYISKCFENIEMQPLARYLKNNNSSIFNNTLYLKQSNNKHKICAKLRNLSKVKQILKSFTKPNQVFVPL